MIRSNIFTINGLIDRYSTIYSIMLENMSLIFIWLCLLAYFKFSLRVGHIVYNSNVPGHLFLKISTLNMNVNSNNSLIISVL